jgi:hypothetical protein
MLQQPSCNNRYFKITLSDLIKNNPVDLSGHFSKFVCFRIESYLKKKSPESNSGALFIIRDVYSVIHQKLPGISQG